VADRVEELDLDSMWVSDHLAWETPILESSLVLAAASSVTRRIELGFAVLQLALRPLAWAAKQVATLQALSGGRVILGVGVGGHPEAEWEAAGMSLADRGRRTDDALRALPSLLAGTPTLLPGTPDTSVTLQPGVATPPVWVGGDSKAALRRAARLGDGWLPAAITLDGIRAGQATLRELSQEAGRPMPAVSVSVFATLDAHLGGMSREALVGMMSDEWGFPREAADQVVLSGTPTEVAERLDEHAESGVEHIIVTPFGGSWRRQCDLLAEAKSLLS